MKRACEYCGTEFDAYPCRVRKGGARYCSKSCGSRGKNPTPKAPYLRVGRDKKLEHITIAENALGHELPVGAQVHHVNENTRDNRNCNLVICEGEAYHKLLHKRTRILRSGGNPNTDRICWACKKAKNLSLLVGNGRRDTDAFCRECARVLTARHRAMFGRYGKRTKPSRV